MLRITELLKNKNKKIEWGGDEIWIEIFVVVS